jgi:hypothetical protein
MRPFIVKRGGLLLGRGCSLKVLPGRMGILAALGELA